jgi:hypothetical protein
MLSSQPRSNVANVLVIGTGAAGLRAAIAAHQAGAEVVVVGKRRRDDAHTVLAAGAPAAVLELAEWGARFARLPDGRLDQPRGAMRTPATACTWRCGAWLEALPHLVDLVSHLAMRLAVDPGGSLTRGRLHQTEDLPVSLVHPVAQIPNGMLVLDRQVGRMSLGDGFQRNAAVDCVHIYEQGHPGLPFSSVQGPISLRRQGCPVVAGGAPREVQ